MLLGEEEAELLVIQFLREHGKATTREIEMFVRNTGKQCPDEAVKFLMKLKMNGKIKGEVSAEAKGWVWFL
jgi:hypothetical protein